MIQLRPKLVGTLVALALLMAATTGCVRQSKYDATMAELTKQTKKLSQVEQEKVQLQTDLDAVKAEAEKAEQAKNDADARIETLEVENADIKKQAPTSESPTE